jgi:hypothetical protein
MTKRLDDRVAELKAKKELIGDGNEAFAHSLIQYFETHGYLSEKQVYWIDRLLARCDAAGNREEKRVEEVFDGTKLRDLFIKASSNLKFPALKIKLPEDSRINIHFYRASSLSKTPGFILITNGKHWPERSLYGSINLKGEGQIAKVLRSEIKTIIRKIAANPVETAKLSGIEFSHCCFCGLELTNKISLYHGYGPICAAKWGLPWEGKEEETKEAKLLDIGVDSDEPEVKAE